MPLSPKAEEAQSWLRKALKDLVAGKHDLKANPPLTEDVVFHAQQAAEKAIKAYLVWNEVRFKKVHGRRCANSCRESISECSCSFAGRSPAMKKCEDVDAVVYKSYGRQCTIRVKAFGSKLAPPTNPPSISGCSMNFRMFSGLIDPP